MKLFLDSANIEEIKRANEFGIICGVTINPSIIAKEGKDFKEMIQQMTQIIDGPISGEVKPTTEEAKDMIREGRSIASLHPNMVVKLPTTPEGLKACHVLSKEGIKTNLTLVFSVPQALLAARAGATYVSMDGLQLIKDIAQIFKIYNLSTQIICASIRNAYHIIGCAKTGADIATVPYSIIEQMIKHPLTDKGLEKFKNDYIAVFGE